MKKIIKILCVLLVVFSFAPIANAEEEPTYPGSITINNTINNKKYELFKIFDLTYQGSEATNNLRVSYTIASGWNNFFLASGAPGAKYLVDVNGYCDGDATKTTQATCEVEETENEWKFYNPTVIPSTPEDIIKYIKITEDNVAEFAETALDYAIKNNLTFEREVTGTGSNVTVNNLELGYYLVYPKGATKIKDSYASICSLDSTTPSMSVNIKAEEPMITKEIISGHANADVGDILTFKITGEVPDTAGFTHYKYQIDDAIVKNATNKGLEMDTSTITVKLGYTDKNDNNQYKTITLDAGDDYTITSSTENDTFSILFDMADEYFQQKIGYDVIVTYNVQVTEPIVSTVDLNTATLTYNNDPRNLSSEVTTNPVSVNVWSSQIKIHKTIKDTETPLADAKFVLYKVIDDVKYYYQAKDSNEAVITSVSATSAVTDVEWVQSEAGASLLVTDEDGLATFEGIANGTYYLLEKEAPEGYNKIARPIEVKVGWDSTIAPNGDWLLTGVTKDVPVENTSGTLLPSTGGLGTKIFLVVGTLAIMTSGVVLVTRARMKKEELN